MGATKTREVEIWKPVPGFESLYTVSNLGSVMSLRSGRLLKPQRAGSNGEYRKVTMYKPGSGATQTPVHRVVAYAFIGLTKGLEVDHRNKDTLDNRVENLRVVSRRENSLRRRKHTSNTSGFTGVGWDHRQKKWRATIKVHGKTKSLGSFDCKLAAAEARRAAEAYYRYGDTTE